MTHAEVKAMVEEMGLPYAYDHFAEGESPDPPFICFLYPRAKNFGADNFVYHHFNRLAIEVYNTLEIKEKKRTVAMQRMLEIKAESPKLDTVQYYWLDDLVGHIEFKQDTVRVFWKCGLESEVALNASKVEEPTHVAELYRNSLDRAQRSENKPVSVVRADKKSVNTREAQRNAAMQTAKNLRAKENGVAANDY